MKRIKQEIKTLMKRIKQGIKALMKRIKQGIKTLMKWIEQGIEAVEKWFISPVRQFFKVFGEWFTTNLLYILIGLLFVLLVIFLFVMFGDSARWIYLLDMGGKGETLRFIGIAIGGLFFATLRVAMSSRKAKGMEDTVKQTEQGQRQERLKNAIEHLGHERSSVRLSGAYELFHLAEDTEELRKTVLEIFCAYICRTTRNEAYQKEYGKKPSEEIQSLLNLLFVQKHDVFDKHRANLQGSLLNGASLTQARLQKADLRNAQLQGAKLDHAHLQGAKLFRAQLQGAELRNTQLQGSDLSYTQLQGTELRNTQMQGANLDCARLQRATLWEAQLQGANLDCAQLQGAVLSRVQLQGANLIYAKLQGADFSEVQLQGIVSSYDANQPYLSLDFAGRIWKRINKDSDYSTVVFSGGLSEDEVNNMKKEILNPKWSANLKAILKPHISPQASSELPSGVNTGTYTQEDAERWIKEYEEAVGRDDAHS